MMQKYVSIAELIQMGYGCRSTLLEQVKTGDFIAKNPGGGKWIVDLESYEEWLERNTVRKRKRRIYRSTRKESIR